MQQPLTPLILAFATGIVTGSYVAPPPASLLAGVFLTLGLLLVFRMKQIKSLIVPCLLVSLYLLGILHISLYLYRKPPHDHVKNHADKGKIEIEGVICENPKIFPDRKELIVSARMIRENGSDIPVQGLVLLSAKIDIPFNYGDYVLCKTNLKTPRNFKNPGGFDYERSLRYRNILVRGFIKNPSEIILLRENQGNSYRSTIENFRSRLKIFIRANSPSPQGEIIQALTLGEQQNIPRNVRDRFNMTGTSHILSVSGFHVGTIAALSIFIIAFLLKRSEYLLLRIDITKVSTFFALLPVMLYASIVGMSFPAIRATLMTMGLLAAILLYKERNLHNILALSALVILAVYPPALFDVSFQLSFAAIISLFTITPRISRLFLQRFQENEAPQPRLNRLLAGVCLLIAVSLGATLGTAPIVALYFNRLSTIVLIANLLVVPLLGTIALPLCLAIIVAFPLSPVIALFLLKIALSFVSASLSIVDYLAAIPGGSFFVTTPTLPEIAVYYLFIVLLMRLIDLRLPALRQEKPERTVVTGRLITISLVACLLFFAAHAVYLHIKDTRGKNLHLTAIDVGQGGATLVQFPGGKKMLVDGGGLANTDFDTGRYVIAPFLWQKRIKTIDVLVLTHPHPDHLQGLLYILDNFDVREVWTNGQMSPHELYGDFIRKIDKKGVTHKVVTEKTGDMETGSVRIVILNPGTSLAGREYDHFDIVNNGSLVIKLIYGEIGLLLPSDISNATEMRLVREGKNLKSDIILVPHHGGYSSSAIPFLRLVSPRIAIVSCGAGNTFGDPHPDVLRRYRMLGARILRTDHDGAVTVSTDGRKVSVHTYRGQNVTLFPE